MGSGRPAVLSMRSNKPLLFSCAAIFALLLLVYLPLRSTYHEHRQSVLSSLASVTKNPVDGPGSSDDKHVYGLTNTVNKGVVEAQNGRPSKLADVRSKYAFATFLAENDPTRPDNYFVATRILTYQLLHAEETRSRDQTIPFLVLVTDGVTEEKRARLRKDGAVVVPVESVDADWAESKIMTWRDVMTKLRLWELVQFDRICFLDGDTVLAAPIDEVFNDPAVAVQTTGSEANMIYADEDALPSTYVLAGVPEMKHKHEFPPTDENHDYPNFWYLNAGFFVLRPSLDIFQYYLSILRTPDKFVPQMPEQNLLNYAHRVMGNMPWQHLNNTLNVHYPTVSDLLDGAKSLHEKWWAPVDRDLEPYLRSWRWRMEGFFEARDALLNS